MGPMQKLILATLVLGVCILCDFGSIFLKSVFSLPSAWKTYRNEKHNFAIQYPDDWKFQKYTMKSGKAVVYVAIDPKETISQEASETMDVARGLIEISFCEDNCSNSINAAIAAQLPEVIIGHGNSVHAKKQERITREREPNPVYSNRKIISYYIGPVETFGDSIICDIVITYIGNLDDKYLNDFNKILSTARYTCKFKFTDPLPELPKG
jgi:hypothetical protein